MLKRFCVRAAMAAFFVAVFFAPKPADAAATLEELVNQTRAAYDLPALSQNYFLNWAAQMKAHDMASKGYFAHTSPEGITPWHWIRLAGYAYEYAGENLAVNFTDADKIENAWLGSPSHRANLMGEHYTDVGTGYAWGTWQGKRALFTAQVYANKTL